jgi:Flp pilus assembly protein TadG
MRVKFASQKGAAMVEFALILIPLLLITFGIVEFGIIMYDKAMVTNASREGARAGIVLRNTADGDYNPLTDTEIELVVTSYLGNHLITFGSGSVGVTCAPKEPRVSGGQLTVTTTYSYDFLVLPNFVTTLTGPINLSATTVMRME